MMLEASPSERLQPREPARAEDMFAYDWGGLLLMRWGSLWGVYWCTVLLVYWFFLSVAWRGVCYTCQSSRNSGLGDNVCQETKAVMSRGKGPKQG